MLLFTFSKKKPIVWAVILTLCNLPHTASAGNAPSKSICAWAIESITIHSTAPDVVKALEERGYTLRPGSARAKLPPKEERFSLSYDRQEGDRTDHFSWDSREGSVTISREIRSTRPDEKAARNVHAKPLSQWVSASEIREGKNNHCYRKVGNRPKAEGCKTTENSLEIFFEENMPGTDFTCSIFIAARNHIYQERLNIGKSFRPKPGQKNFRKAPLPKPGPSGIK